jgi:protein gp37
MVLTKRPERLYKFIRSDGWMNRNARKITKNIYLGTTAGTQERADVSWSSMAWLAQQGWNTWVSSEPRLSAINWNGWSFLKLMVTGGESGPRARPMYPAWPRADRDWCQENGVPFWFKQWGEWAPAKALPEYSVTNAVKLLDGIPMTHENGEFVFRIGRKKAGRDLDGRTWEETSLPSPYFGGEKTKEGFDDQGRCPHGYGLFEYCPEEGCIRHRR